MELTEQQIRAIVQNVVKNLAGGGVPAPAGAPPTPLPEIREGDGIFADLEAAVAAAAAAQKKLLDLGLARREEIIEAIREAGRRHAELFSRLAVTETGMGRVADKIKKNLLVSNKTPGVEDLQPVAWTGDHGLTIMERAPFGLIGAIIPSTNPTSTVICNSIEMIAAGNAVVFGPHPGARVSSQTVIQTVNRAIVAAGGPPNLAVAVLNPTIETATAMMKHPATRILCVTGGPGVVKAAMQMGKKVIAAGPGNPPVVVDETADLQRAGRMIVAGASFDNNVVCVCEKEIIALDSVADELKRQLVKNGAYEITGEAIARLKKAIIARDPGPDCEEGAANKKLVGRDARVILREIGIEVGDEVKIVLAEVPPDHPFVLVEQLMPVIPLVRVKTVEEAIDLAVKVEHGYRHSMYMYSTSVANLSRMARECDSSIFVKNGPCFSGLGFGGEGFCSFSIASPTGEGITRPIHFTRARRCVLVDYFRIV